VPASRLDTRVTVLAIARAAFGVPAVVAPGAAVRLVGQRRACAGRYFAAFFGVRELLLAGFLLAARRDPPLLRSAVAFGALADLGDTVLLLREIATGRATEPGAKLLLGTGLAGSVAFGALWREVRAASP
jgi:hypothetical protein